MLPAIIEVTTMHHRLLIARCLAALLRTSDSAPGQNHDRNSYLGKSPPEIVSESHHWIGASEQLTLEKLKGKVVWLQFNF